MNSTRYIISTDSIPTKGIGFLTVYDPSALREGVDELLRKGAVSIFVNGAVSSSEQQGLLLSPSYDQMSLSRSLQDIAAPEGKLTLKPLTRRVGAAFLSMYNECIITHLFHSTQSIADLEWLLSDQWLTGIAWLGEIPVGIYECQLTEQGTRLHAFALLKDWRGKGLGRELLRQVLNQLPGDTVSTQVDSNSAAFHLLRSEGFRAEDLVASWHRVEVIPE